MSPAHAAFQVETSRLFRSGRELLPGIMTYLATYSFAALYALFLFIQIRLQGAACDPYDIAGVTGYAQNAILVLNAKEPYTIALLAAGLALTSLILRGWPRRFLIMWALALTLLYLNPFSANLLIDTLIPRNIYWRLFFLYPFPLATALVATRLISAPGGRWRAPVSLGAVGLISGIALTHYLSYLPRLKKCAFRAINCPSDR